MLFTYLRQLQRFIRDAKQELIDPEDLMDYVNKARREVAMRSQCLRRLTPISGSIISASVVAGGSGYTAPTVSISAPDFPSGQLPYPNGAQAVGIATQIGGTITAVNFSFGGAGYFVPQASIVDPHGAGASISLTISPINLLNLGQEVYPFSGVDLSAFPGIKSIYMIRSVSVIYSNYRYSVPMYSFSTYQAFIRQFPFQYSYVPTLCSQFGQGGDGSLYAYPFPSQTYQWEWDCSCLPTDLETDQDFEAIPDPWRDAVPFLAAYYCFGELQNLNAARYYKEEFTDWVHRFSGHARPGRWTNPYGRFFWPFISAGSVLAASLLGGSGLC